MDSEKQKRFIIHFLYYSLITCCMIIFFRYIIYVFMPFLIGFSIAFLLHPIIRRCSLFGYEKLWSIIVILIFYAFFAILITWLSLKGFYYIQKWMVQMPAIYEHYIAPYLNISLSSVQSVWKGIDINSAQIIESIMNSLQNSLSSFVSTISRSVLSFLTNVMTSIPNLLLSFFFAIVSSFFINSDYPRITTFIKNHVSITIQNKLNQTQIFLRTTLYKLVIAYGKLMLLTFIELWIGLSLLHFEQAHWIALGIALFDIIPVLGTGGIMLPWIIISYLNHQSKLAIGLLILYLLITILRNIIEPRIVGRQIGLHPLIMLICMYAGGKILGPLGIFILPILILIAQNLYQNP